MKVFDTKQKIRDLTELPDVLAEIVSEYRGLEIVQIASYRPLLDPIRVLPDFRVGYFDAKTQNFIVGHDRVGQLLWFDLSGKKTVEPQKRVDFQTDSGQSITSFVDINLDRVTAVGNGRCLWIYTIRGHCIDEQRAAEWYIFSPTTVVRSRDSNFWGIAYNFRDRITRSTILPFNAPSSAGIHLPEDEFRSREHDKIAIAVNNNTIYTVNSNKLTLFDRNTMKLRREVTLRDRSGKVYDGVSILIDQTYLYIYLPEREHERRIRVHSLEGDFLIETPVIGRPVFIQDHQIFTYSANSGLVKYHLTILV